MRISGTKDLYYWEGEKPRPLLVSWTDEDGVLDASIASAGLAALTKIDGAAEVVIPMTNLNDGTMTIDWPTGASASAFVVGTGRVESMMTIDIRVQEPTGGSGKTWFIDRFSIPIRKR